VSADNSPGLNNPAPNPQLATSSQSVPTGTRPDVPDVTPQGEVPHTCCIRGWSGLAVVRPSPLDA
jgi:hypothetical protein